MIEKITHIRAKKFEREFTVLLKALKPNIRDEYRADEEDILPSMSVTFSADADLLFWNYQTGDNSFTGGAYGCPFWGVVTLYRRSISRDLARDAIDQIVDQL